MRSPKMAVIAHCLQSLLAGAVAGVVSVAALVLTDVGSIGTVMLDDPSGWIAFTLLASAFASTFGIAAVCSALLEISGSDDNSVTGPGGNPHSAGIDPPRSEMRRAMSRRNPVPSVGGARS
jgi:hypothetical protein